MNSLHSCWTGGALSQCTVDDLLGIELIENTITNRIDVRLARPYLPKFPSL